MIFLPLNTHVIVQDGGEEKRKLCFALGADHWIDFTTCKDVTTEIKRVTEGKGAHAAIVTTASVSLYSITTCSLIQPRQLSPAGILKLWIIFARTDISWLLVYQQNQILMPVSSLQYSRASQSMDPMLGTDKTRLSVLILLLLELSRCIIS